MIELDNQDPRVKACLSLMITQLSSLVTKEADWSLTTVSDAEDMMERLRMDFKRTYGFDFPEMTAFYMPSVALLLFYRRDLDYPVIRDHMVILAQKLARRGVRPDPMEMSEAMMRAWPHVVKRDSGVDDIANTAKNLHVKTSTLMN